MAPSGPSNKMNIKALIVAGVFTLCLCVGMPIALFWKQVISYDKYEALAINQQTRDKILEPSRGTIYDTNMKELAVSANVEQITIDPSIIDKEKAPQTAETLALLLELDYEWVLEKLEKNSKYEVLKRRVEKAESDTVREYISEERVKGIYILPDTKRYYPQGNLASNLIGFTGSDGDGLWGLEAYYNKTLSGTPGRLISARDAQGDEMPFDYEQLIEPQNGSSIVLTIDEVIQYFLEKHLETARADNKPAEGVAGIIMNVKTGEILAMATKPDFDLNEPFVISDEMLLAGLDGLEGEEYTAMRKSILENMWRNKPVVDSYEPGSTFKIVTMAMAYEESLVNENSTFYCSGSKVVADRTIRCWKHYGHGSQNLINTLENSCNPAMMDIGAMIGTDTFVKYFEAFGFTTKTNIDLSGETSGIFFDSNSFNEVELAVSTFGQTFQITPLQLITSISAIVNDGYMVRPHVVKEILDEDGKIIDSTSTEAVRQVVSEETSAFIRDAMEAVVTTGTARNAYVSGYRVGGKTATSQKRSKEILTGKSHYIASFIGVAPMDDPEIAVLIMIDEPSGALTQGGQIAAPVVGRIMADVLPYIGVQPEYTTEELASIDVTTPNLIGVNKDQVSGMFSGQNSSYRFVGDGDTVTDQVPAPGAKVPSSATVILYMGGSKPTGSITVPNIIGKTASQAKEILESAGLYMRATGASAMISSTVSVKATKQSPTASQQAAIGSVVNVEFTDTDNVSD